VSHPWCSWFHSHRCFPVGASDLVGDGLDIEVRLGEAPDSSLICRRLGMTTAYLVAAPSYLARRPAPISPEEICGHECISYLRASDGNIWQFSGGPEVISVKIDARLQATNAAAVHRVALAGAGMAILSHILAIPDIEAGGLVHVLPDFPPMRLPILAYYPSRQNMPLRVNTVLEFLAQVVQEDDAMKAGLF
jgi:DNA-binding transcriptional LysR family regulator